MIGAIIIKRSRDARVVELADSLDSGSSAHSGRAGSSPASRTKTKTTIHASGLSFLFWFSSLFTLLSSLFSEGSQTPYRFFLVLAVRVNNR